ncbi:MAG: hypothetical protein BMS9Abin28_0542 [Anaerolineae bacterium]|nr:MAG: hypothetical protein BMS9Abin28_0542 [Anaerolineae bacterium]
MSTAVPPSLVRPTLETAFHIDYGWWDRSDRNLDVYLRSHLCREHQEMYTDIDRKMKVDHVDLQTAEVSVVSRIEHLLTSHCAQQDDYLTPQTSLVNGVFRVFLANGNTPLMPEELAHKIGRPARMILRTLSGPRVYKGIRPAH